MFSEVRIAPVQTSPGVGDGEAESEDGVALDAYSHVLAGVQAKAVGAMSDVLGQNGASRSKGLGSTG
jgi:hypothetical protein